MQSCAKLCVYKKHILSLSQNHFMWLKLFAKAQNTSIYNVQDLGQCLCRNISSRIIMAVSLIQQCRVQKRSYSFMQNIYAILQYCCSK